MLRPLRPAARRRDNARGAPCNFGSFNAKPETVPYVFLPFGTLLQFLLTLNGASIGGYDDPTADH